MEARTYFNTMAEAIAAGFEYAEYKGFQVQDDSRWKWSPIYRGESEKQIFDLTDAKTGKALRKCLTIALYRMDSGNYELTAYIG
jgi:hypothetical protein